MEKAPIDLIADAEDRQGRLPKRAASRKPVIDPGVAIVLAAVIIVGGLWGGKLAYDYVQEQRAIAALNKMNREMERVAAEAQQRLAHANAMAAQARMEREKQSQLAREKAARDLRFQSPECQFWKAQFELNPTPKNNTKYQDACWN
ncbi:hypothetical protein [Pseudomonas tohonis]|uniref:hypothetical protein n=1 Tax=Pseudomonas tohonis TaxID=2725477 RepID=UPI00255BFE93|nr:hypothetical protein [Pseudomonas tohonis]